MLPVASNKSTLLHLFAKLNIESISRTVLVISTYIPVCIVESNLQTCGGNTFFSQGTRCFPMPHKLLCFLNCSKSLHQSFLDKNFYVWVRCTLCDSSYSSRDFPYSNRLKSDPYNKQSCPKFIWIIRALASALGRGIQTCFQNSDEWLNRAPKEHWYLPTQGHLQMNGLHYPFAL